VSDCLDLGEADDGKLFRIRIDNTGEERIARYHWLWLAGRELRFPCFADPDHPDKLVALKTYLADHATRLATPIHFAANGPTYRRYPPRLGEHNAELRALADHW